MSTLPRFRRTVHVGDRIRDKHSGRTGTCLYVGPADFARGKDVRFHRPNRSPAGIVLGASYVDMLPHTRRLPMPRSGLWPAPRHEANHN